MQNDEGSESLIAQTYLAATKLSPHSYNIIKLKICLPTGQTRDNDFHQNQQLI